MPVTVNTTAPPVKKSTPVKKTAVNLKTQERAESINGFGQLGQAVLLMVKQPADAGAVAAHWPNISLEIAKLADTDERVARMIDNLETVGPYAGIITAVMPFALQILVNHDKLPAEPMANMGILTKRAMEAKVSKSMAEAEVIAIQQEKEALELLAQERMSYRAMADAMQDYTEETANA